MTRAYTYKELVDDMLKLNKDFPLVETGVIGKSLWGRNLYYIKVGSGREKIMYNAAHHGMEWLTSAMLMRFVRDFLEQSGKGGAMAGFNIPALTKRVSLYIVPMVNPDGVSLSATGIPNSLNIREKQRLLNMNESSDFTKWQANARGVDLNHNYNAMWKRSKAMEAEYGIYKPGPTRFSGPCAESEPESRALANFTRKQNFMLTISFHSQGKVIYHGFMGKEPQNSLKIARAFTTISPYVLDETEGIASYGGYKDWFVNEFNRPGFTVEVGEGENPLPISDLDNIYKETLPILLGAMTVKV